jgi:DNA-directed RNA polymerase specialized sigma24 family protein
MSEPRDPGVDDSELGDPEPESQLIARLLAGEPGAVQLVRGWVRSTLKRYGSSLGSEIEDLEQQALLDLLESLEGGQFRGHSRFETYVRAFARYRSIDRLRAQGRREVVALDDLRSSRRCRRRSRKPLCARARSRPSPSWRASRPIAGGSGL